MTVITQDRKRLFERITSGCLDMNINIVDARIFSNKSNVIDILWIQDNFGKMIVFKLYMRNLLIIMARL